MMPSPEQIEAARAWCNDAIIVDFAPYSDDPEANVRAVKVGIESLAALLEAREAAARAEEREACADIADQHSSIEGIAQKIAAAIRARGGSNADSAP